MAAPKTTTPGRARPDSSAATRDGERRRRVRQIVLAGGAVVLVVAIVVVAGAFKKDPAGGGSTVQEGGFTIRGGRQTAALLRGLPRHGTTLGRPDAPATILEIADLKCPGCQAHELRTQSRIVDRLVRTGRANLQLQLVDYRDGPAGTSDGAAARRAAYNLVPSNRFWPFVDALYWNQGPETEAWASDALLRAVAAATPGLRSAAAVNTRETPASRSAVEAADRLASAIGVDETPSIYVLPRGSRTGVRVEATDDVDAIARAVEAAGRTAG